jgi:TPR repeat protein
MRRPSAVPASVRAVSLRASLMTATLLATSMLAGCERAPPLPAEQIEALAMTATQQASPDAERQLRQLADAGNMVARRELGILYRRHPARQGDAKTLLRQAALAGDAQAAGHLGDIYRSARDTDAAAAATAWEWYERAAEGGQARAALMLGLMARNGEGVPRDAATAARWLQLASDLGNPHAMFLLSYAFRDGDGVPRDPERALALLEESAEREYPPALQELALTVDDPERASHLMKEATEHRRNHWNRF